jgi:Utp21 specific WD40 associated putative domain
MIELPSISQNEVVKHSHKDFYADEEMKKEDAGSGPANQNLIQAKFNALQENLKKTTEQREQYVRLSNQPFSKWQAIFNLEQIKERNKPTLPKKELPKAPFFLFDIEKVLLENDATTDLIKEQFYSKKNKD